MSDSVRSHRQQPTRLLCPWDSPGKNPGVGCHCLLHGCESWTIKKAECQHTFELWSWRVLKIPWATRSSNQSVLKEINPECSLEGLMLKLKFQYLGYLMCCSPCGRKELDTTGCLTTCRIQDSVFLLVAQSSSSGMAKI